MTGTGTAGQRAWSELSLIETLLLSVKREDCSSVAFSAVLLQLDVKNMGNIAGQFRHVKPIYTPVILTESIGTSDVA